MSGTARKNEIEVEARASQLDAEYVLPTYNRLPLQIVSGRGTEVVGADGRTYLDFVTGLSVNNFGHCHPRVVAAVREQVGRLIHCSNLFLTEPQARVAARLSGLAGGGRVFFSNSGAEANECALKIARKRGTETGGGRIVFVEHSFHGRTIGTLSATGQPSKQAPFGLPLPGYQMVPRHDADALRASFAAGGVAAFIAEPVQGESGVHPLGAEYLQEAETLCRENDAIFIMDEIQTGLGRCGAPFAYQRYGLNPDVVTLAKSLAGGLPIGATIARNAAANVLTAGDHGTTFGGGPVPGAAALVVLDLLEEPGLFARVEQAGRRLEGWLQRLVDKGAAETVRRLGLMVATDLVEPIAREIVTTGIQEGVLVNATSEVTLRFLPPLTVSDEEIDRVGEFLWRHLGDGRQ
ncbi:MAG: aminotransferase class III-fold pyridoxal phosphate-dependent enzyme [Actinobacteria bacterium]|nr:aminotransferase class III-fold pyridoxal phosphate-dependent enzyme [Actinomycetota bacterium]